jgi:hypothetical protein
LINNYQEKRRQILADARSSSLWSRSSFDRERPSIHVNRPVIQSRRLRKEAAAFAFSLLFRPKS